MSNENRVELKDLYSTEFSIGCITGKPLPE